MVIRSCYLLTNSSKHPVPTGRKDESLDGSEALVVSTVPSFTTVARTFFSCDHSCEER